MVNKTILIVAESLIPLKFLLKGHDCPFCYSDTIVYHNPTFWLSDSLTVRQKDSLTFGHYSDSVAQTKPAAAFCDCWHSLSLTIGEYDYDSFTVQKSGS